MPSPVMTNRVVEITKTLEEEINEVLTTNTMAKEYIGNTEENLQEIKDECENLTFIAKEYKSPLDALGDTS